MTGFGDLVLSLCCFLDPVQIKFSSISP